MSKIYSVTEVNNYINGIFVRDGVLRRICIKGEISGCKYNSSGHIYFTLKDQDSRISAAIFRNSRVNLDFDLKDGQSVVCEGEVNLYAPAGTYSLIVRNIELSGKGDLFAQFEKLKAKLGEEGLFDPGIKKPIPRFVTKLGVATASTGAALQDILNITWRRNPHTKVYLAACKVQGEGAALTICKALKKLDKENLDVIIVGRGGGSIEDLWAFNEEIVARTIYEMKTPVISAVGHEVDFTICDFAADLRAPTPSAAAELAIFEYKEFQSMCVDIRYDMLNAVNKRIEELRASLANLSKYIEYNKPQNKINSRRIELDTLKERMNAQLKNRISEKRFELAGLKPRMRSLIDKKITITKGDLKVIAADLEKHSPLNKIASGYAYIENDNRSVRSVDDIKIGDELNVTVTDGSLTCTVKDKVSKDIWSI